MEWSSAMCYGCGYCAVIGTPAAAAAAAAEAAAMGALTGMPPSDGSHVGGVALNQWFSDAYLCALIYV